MSYCPRCQQPLPDPPDRFCPSCGTDLAATPPTGDRRLPPDVRPARATDALAPVVEPAGPDAGPPWERRDRIGFASALVETVQQVLMQPVRFFQSMPVTGGIGSPLLFGVIVGYVGSAAAALYGIILQTMLGSSFRIGRGTQLEQILPYLQGGTALVVQLVFGPVFVVIGLFVFSGILHLMLLLLGGAQRGFEATFRVVCYATTAALIGIVPFCGAAIGRVYWLVLAILGLAEAHRIGRGRSAAAVLLPVLFLCCCCAAGIAMAVGGLASLIQHAR